MRDEPEPNPHGPPTVLLAGVGDVMTAVAGEVADGILCHGFTIERYLREVTRPALSAAGRAAASPVTRYPAHRPTGRTEEALTEAHRGVREQIAF